MSETIFIYKHRFLCSVHAEVEKQRLYKRKGGVNALSLRQDTLPQGPYKANPWEKCEECTREENTHVMERGDARRAK